MRGSVAPGTKRRKERGTTRRRHRRVSGSAGSLEALESLFRALAPQTTSAFLVVTHRDPESRGLLVPILTRFTRLKVQDAVHGAKLERGAVYVVPANKHLDMRDGCIELRARPTDARARTPIDSMFRAIAAAHHERGIGVVLSGMGADGSVGLGVIKEQLGVALVQEPTSAAYDSMPLSAINAGLADFVGTPATLAKTLNALADHERAAVGGGAQEKAGDGALPYDSADVLTVVRHRTGHDFSQYKSSTILRRIERRMNLHRIKDVPAYIALLERDPGEIDRLFGDLLIGMTRFFRDPEVFEALAKHALPSLLRDRTAEHPLRVWVPGCASGEEAYSLAMLIAEAWSAHGEKSRVHVQIYATDLDRAAIDRARKGCYGLDIAVDVSRERLARFFTEDSGCYRVKKDIRDMVVFATQNLISDPPFTKLDVLSCRNVLIYLQPELQRKLIRLFLYALVPGGILVLGTAETVSGFEDGFSAIDGEQRIYRRRLSAHGLEQTVAFPLETSQRARLRPDARVAAARRRSLLPEVVQREVIEHVAPPIVVIEKGGDLLFASQRTGRYFEPPAGKGSLNVFAMAREGLALPLRTAVRKAVSRNTKVTERGVRVRTNGSDTLVDLTISPIHDPEYPGTVMIAIAEVRVPKGAGDGGASPPKSKRKAADRAALAELRQTQAKLDAVIDEMSHSQEALKTANEDLQSANEELQSTNEELTTSKEEMQSMNEELLTLNAELQTTNEQLATTNDDMRNLLNSSQIPTLFLDNHLRLKRYTAQALRIARLIPSDVGRPVTDLVWNIQYETLAHDVKQVLHSLVFKEAEVTATDGCAYTMRIHPYRTVDDIIDGVVITFMDITIQKRAERLASERERRRILEEVVTHWAGVAYVEEVASGRSLVVSRATESILGYPRSMLSNATEDFWHTLRRVARGKKPAARGLAYVSLRKRDGTLVRYGERRIPLMHAAAGRDDATCDVAYVLHVFRRVEPESPHGRRKAKAKRKA